MKNTNQLKETMQTDVQKTSQQYQKSIQSNAQIDDLDMIADDIFGSPDDVLVEEESLKIQLGKAMECLSDREKNIVNCYFGIDGEPMTLAQIGEEYQLTKERIRQIKESAIRKIRHNTDGVFDYLM